MYTCPSDGTTMLLGLLLPLIFYHKLCSSKGSMQLVICEFILGARFVNHVLLLLLLLLLLLQV
jgi:hypothetical protein